MAQSNLHELRRTGSRRVRLYDSSRQLSSLLLPLRTNILLEPPELERFDFNNLIDIEKGIISKNLVEKSKVISWGSRTQGVPSDERDNLSEQFCSVCRENFEYVDITRQLACEHIFHINCIDTWFTKNKTCPECRCEI